MATNSVLLQLPVLRNKQGRHREAKNARKKMLKWVEMVSESRNSLSCDQFLESVNEANGVFNSLKKSHFNRCQGSVVQEPRLSHYSHQVPCISSTLPSMVPPKACVDHFFYKKNAFSYLHNTMTALAEVENDCLYFESFICKH